ncbi:unnamed protein product [Didymodactylos carnosus]|uniref:Uncharacterized protein n=1 Tax=Didymodactylos carnosus TaxID=1234261 RepID=A0A814A5Z1_9BILA|nr:unnamed protein product [Didymodactylos carnosus]CAF0961929.1 unnamed protein product [Didymodactylos carnosus]CAF3690389.1 unnamed protein product [Didymodactylos carnosus]CAF3734769.1 unnamed protein product [Didymodactylos carnosus]
MSSISPKCQNLKEEYDSCFNHWFSENYLKGDTTDKCNELFTQYQRCIKEAIKEHKIQLWELEQDSSVPTVNQSSSGTRTAGNQSRYFNDRSSSSSSQRNHDRSLLYSNDMTHDNNAFINNNNSDKEDKKLNRQSLCNSLLTATTISDTLDCTVHNDIALEIMNEERTSISEKRNENFTKKQANDTSSSRYRESRKRPASPSYRSSTNQLHSENEVLSILNGNTKPFILKKDNQLHVKKTNDKLLIAPTSPCSIVQKNEQLSTTSTSVPHMFSLPIETSPPIIKDVEALDVTMLDLVSTLKSLQSNPPATVSEANKLMNKKQSSSNVVNDINSLDKDIYELIQRQLTIHRKHLEHKEREVALKEMELIQREKQFNDRLKQRTTATSPLRNELSSSLIVTENEKVKQISSPSRKAKTTTVTNNTNQLTENIEPKTSKNENIIVSNQDEKNKTKIAETQLSVLEGGKITKTKPTVSNAEEKMDSLQVSFPNETIRLKPTIEKVPAHLRKSRLNDISTASSPQPVRSNIKSRSRATILDATVFASTFPIPDLYSEEDIKLVPQQSPNNENPTLLSVESVTGSRRKVEFIRNKSQEQLQSTPILRTTSNEVSLDDETIAITTTIPVVDLRLTLEKNRKRIQEEQPVPDTPSIVKDETPIDENQVLLTKILSVESKFDQGENMEEVEEELMVTSKKPMKSIDSKDDQRRSKRQSRFSSHYSSTRQQHSKDYVRNVTSEKTKQHYSTNHIPTNTMYSSDHLSVPHANRMHPYELQQYIDMAHSKHHPRPNTDETDADLRARLYHQRQRSNMKNKQKLIIMSLSDEEFQRFQNQLVELKTKNYQLEEQNKKISDENTHLRTQIENIDKDSIRLPTKVKNLSCSYIELW